jgi:hypothetical protein
MFVVGFATILAELYLQEEAMEQQMAEVQWVWALMQPPTWFEENEQESAPCVLHNNSNNQATLL